MMRYADEGRYQWNWLLAGVPGFAAVSWRRVVVSCCNCITCGCGSSECLILPVGDLVRVGVIFDKALSPER